MAVNKGVAVVPNQTETRESSSLSRNQILVALGLGLIVALGAFLRFYKLGAYSIGNSYYAATVQSMLTSWKNFFFAAFEPSGSVTVDKPPLGFWVQAASAYVLGVNGFALALPQALAGTLSIPLLYGLVKRPFGRWAGLIAALVLAVTPVAVSTERNNTIDGLLLFVLLLAAWAFMRATRTGRPRDLLLGAFLVSLGFNIKMLQAFLPLPAFYAMYLLGAPLRWWKRVVYLALATALLLAVSLAWAVAVDLTPADERPYVGSSADNTVMELILRHNGARRLSLSMGSNNAPSPVTDAGQARQRPGSSPPAPNSGNHPPAPPNGAQPNRPFGNPPAPPNGGQIGQFRPVQQPPDGPPGDAGSFNPPPPQPGAGNQPDGATRPTRQPNGRNQEVGQPGWTRLFTEPLVVEAGWLLPLALLGIPLILIALGRPWPLGETHLALVLWAGWLLPEVVYFTFNGALFHAYYLIMLGPPLAALIGVTAWALAKVCQKSRWLGWTLLALLAGGTLLFQIITLRNYPDYAGWIALIAGLGLALGLGLLAWAARNQRPWLSKTAIGIAVLSLTMAPLLWSGLTALNANLNTALPRSGPDSGGAGHPNLATGLSPTQEAVLDYVSANVDPDGYLLATLSAMEASPYILATQRPVLTFGGFSGSDNVIDIERLAQMVADGELKFVLNSERLGQQKPEIAVWLRDHCSAVTLPGSEGPEQNGVLYNCGSGRSPSPQPSSWQGEGAPFFFFSFFGV